MGTVQLSPFCNQSDTFIATKGQEAVWSWFLPPSAWNPPCAGLRWPEWTERCESWFVKLLQDIHSGKARPRSQSDWISHLRGQKLIQSLVDNNQARASTFLDEVIPI